MTYYNYIKVSEFLNSFYPAKFCTLKFKFVTNILPFFDNQFVTDKFKKQVYFNLIKSHFTA